MKYNDELNNLINEYGLASNAKDNDSARINYIINDIIRERCHGRRCIIWGAGRMNITHCHAAFIMKKYATHLQNLLCIVDSEPKYAGLDFLGKTVMLPQDAVKLEPEIIIIASKGFNVSSIKKSINQYFPSCEYLDIYEELDKRDILVYGFFYGSGSVYLTMYETRMAYERASQHEKPQLLKDLIGAYLSIRDFYYTFYFIDQYIAMQYTGYEALLTFKTALLALLDNLRASCSEKEDYIMFFIDSLRSVDVFDETGEPQIFKEYTSSGTYFTNAFATAPITYESISSFLAGRYPFEKNVYANYPLHFDECDFLKTFWQEGYKTHIVTDFLKFFNEDERLHFTTDMYYIPEKMWHLLCSIADDAGKSFYLVYMSYEIHAPMICGYHTVLPDQIYISDMGNIQFTENSYIQQIESIDYVDKQFDYYYSFAPRTTKIITGDHGYAGRTPDINKPFYMYHRNPENTIKIPIIISREGKKEERISTPFSHIDYNKLLVSTIRGEAFNIPVREVIQYSIYPIHNPGLRAIAFERGFTDYIDGILCYLKDDLLYVITGTGIEEVFKGSDKNTNIIDSEAGKAFVQYIKASYNTTIPIFD